MDYNTRNNWTKVDWFTVLLYLVMIIAGWLTICGASYEFDIDKLFDPSGRPMNQLVWMGISTAVACSILIVERDFYEVFAYLIYGAVILLLVATIFLAPDIKGSHSWLVLGPIRLQPAEFAKFATALAVARLMGTYGFMPMRPKNFMMIVGLIVLPMLCILLQQETGSALVYFAFFLMLYREGMSGYFLLAGVCAVAYFVIGMKYAEVTVLGCTNLGILLVSLIILVITTVLVYVERKNVLAVKVIAAVSGGVLLIGGVVAYFFPFDLNIVVLSLLGAVVLYLIGLSVKEWVWHYVLIAVFTLCSMGFLFSVNYVFNDILEPHQQVRIKVSLGLKDDPSGAGYNVNQSKIAIGSGGFLGKGFLNGTQTKLKYVPEQDTDFIFCTIGEEEGFVGSAAVLILFGVFILRLVHLAERQDTTFARVYGYSVASIFIFHLAINIGMVLGMTPVIGIPLPFFSYGGSSLLGFTILLFIFLKLDAARRDR